MAAPPLLDVLVEAALVGLVKGGVFPQISYDSNGTPSPVEDPNNAGHPLSLAPTVVTANPVASEFEVEKKHGLSLRYSRSVWTWSVQATWDSRVSLEPFEKAMLAAPTVVPRDPANGINQQAELRFTKAGYALSPQGQTTLAASPILTMQPGKAALRAKWIVHVTLSSDRTS